MTSAAGLISLPDLFRGDTCAPPGGNATNRGQTFADQFLTTGLVAKFANGGDPKWERLSLPYLVAAHVGYEKKTKEEKVSFYIPMLSFSESLDAAWYFADRTMKKKFEVVPFAQATHIASKSSSR